MKPASEPSGWTSLGPVESPVLGSASVWQHIRHCLTVSWERRANASACLQVLLMQTLPFIGRVHYFIH